MKIHSNNKSQLVIISASSPSAKLDVCPISIPVSLINSPPTETQSHNHTPIPSSHTSKEISSNMTRSSGSYISGKPAKSKETCFWDLNSSSSTTRNSHISTRIAGTVGYMAPEYAMRGYLTEKADVYSFGIVALQFVYLLDWVGFIRKKKQC